MGNAKLDALAELLERSGDDPERLDIVQRAQRFKRSWVELAQGLCGLRASRAYERWGYDDLHAYCQHELALRGATVDKLLLSFTTIERHAPEVLRNDGVARPIPSLEATDYFSRALGENDGAGRGPSARRVDAPPDVLDELRSAVFDEGRSIGELRKRFNPVLSPRSPETEAQDSMRKLTGAARRVTELLEQVEGLTEARVARTKAALEALLRDLETLGEPVAMAKKSSSRAARQSAKKIAGASGRQGRAAQGRAKPKRARAAR